MKYKIICRAYTYSGECPQLNEYLREIEARFFKIENGFVALWFEDNKTQIPNLYINANDVITIKTL